MRWGPGKKGGEGVGGGGEMRWEVRGGGGGAEGRMIEVGVGEDGRGRNEGKR